MWLTAMKPNEGFNRLYLFKISQYNCYSLRGIMQLTPFNFTHSSQSLIVATILMNENNQWQQNQRF